MDLPPPDNHQYIKALKLRMQILFENDDLDAALATVVKAEQAFPTDQDLRYAHMEMLMLQKRFAEAEAVAQKAMKDWPTTRIWRFSGPIWRMRGGTRRAVCV